MDTTIQRMLDCLQEPAIAEYNTRMSYIANVIQKYKYLGTKIDVALTDNLADKSLEELTQLNIVLHGLCTDYARITLDNQRKGLDYE